MRTVPELSSSGAALAPITAAEQAGWHSPVPYLFGGLGAMLALIALALLMLACSFWRLSSCLEGGAAAHEAEAESGEREEAASGGGARFAQGIVVIMAGDEKATFLATPISFAAAMQHETQQQ